MDHPVIGRRDFLGLAGISPALAAMSGAIAAPAAQGAKATIYERLLDVRPVINAIGPATTEGGTLLSREVLAAMAEAACCYVDLVELYAVAGSRLAKVTKAQAAMITAGGFASMVLGAAACLAGDDEAKLAALPMADWPRRETLIQRAHVSGYERAYRNAGMTVVQVGTEEELLAALGERTAMIAGLSMVEKSHQPGIIPIERLIAIGKRAGVPVFIDASFSLDQAQDSSVLWRYTQMGADLVSISGGKALRAPQSTGILAGREDLIAAARSQMSPNPAGFARGMKVDKEEVIGLLVALEQFLVRDHRAAYRRDRKLVESMRGQLRDIPGLRLGYEEAFFGPGLVLMWDEAEIPLSYDDFVRKMREGNRPIAVLHVKGPSTYFVESVEGPALFVGALKDGEEEVVVARAREILLAARAAPSARAGLLDRGDLAEEVAHG